MMRGLVLLNATAVVSSRHSVFATLYLDYLRMSLEQVSGGDHYGK
jgi:hypothetical protein